jgi:hypothetical protein
MEITLAKEFMLHKDFGDDDKIYFSKDVHKLIDINNGELWGIKAVIDTPKGEKMLPVGKDYDGDLIIEFGLNMIHKTWWLNYYKHCEVIYIK